MPDARPTLADTATLIRAKNAGPFWLTLDIFAGDLGRFDEILASPSLSREAIGSAYKVDPTGISIYSLPDLKVVKISMPRRTVQGSFEDTDMHSGQQHVPLASLPLH